MNSQIHQEIIHILHNLIRPRYISHSSPPIHHLTSRNLLQEDHLTTITQLFHGNRAVTHNSINKRTLRVSSPNEIRRIQTKSRKKKKWLVLMKCIATFKNRVPHAPNESNVCARINDTRYTLAAILSAR